MSNRAGPPPVAQRQAPDTMALVVRGMDDRSGQFAALIGPEHWERWKTVALHALAQNDNVLRRCTATSILEAIRESATLNLSPTGLLGEGWLIPYGDTAKFQPGWRGYLKLLRNSGQVAVVDTQIVYMNDDFDISFGTEPRIHHVPLLFGEKGEDGTYLADRGDYRGVYAFVRQTNGQLVIEWMPWPEVMKIRAVSPSVQRGQQSPWDNYADEMARKTVLRRLMKRLPLDSMPRVAAATAIDEAGDVIEGQAVEVGATPSVRATAAAYALGHSATTDDNGPPGTSTGVTEAPEPATVAGCGAGSPYDDSTCTLAAGHPNNHKAADGSSWS